MNHQHPVCSHGHPMEGRNLILYPDGSRRECRACKYRRNAEQRKLRQQERREEQEHMTLKALIDAIQDSKIQADVVVSDRGRLQPVMGVRASANVVMLVCRPRPKPVEAEAIDAAFERAVEAEAKQPLRSHDFKKETA